MKKTTRMQAQNRGVQHLVLLPAVALVVCGGLVGCASNQTNVPEGSAPTPVVESQTATPPIGKIRIDFEGVIASVDKDRVQLDTGQTVVFTSETVFTDYTGVLVEPQLSAGVSIQGSTGDNPSAMEITADRVHVVALP